MTTTLKCIALQNMPELASCLHDVECDDIYILKDKMLNHKAKMVLRIDLLSTSMPKSSMSRFTNMD